MATRLALFLLIQSCSCIHLPVILIDYTGTVLRQASANPFKVMPTSTFAYIIHDAMYRSDNLLVFLEEYFGVEDISSRDRYGTPFRYLHEMFLEQNAKYISRVHDPFGMLHQILPANSSSITIVTDNDEIKINKDIKYHFIHFMEPRNYMSETRIERLRRHDVMIKQTYRSLISKRSGLIVVFYTGKAKPREGSSKRTPQPVKPEPPESHMLVTDQALIRLTGVKLQQGSKRTTLATTRASTRRLALQLAATRVQYDDELELDFNFEYTKEGWLLDSIVLVEGGEEVGRKRMGIGAPYGYSYFCSEPLFIVNSRDKSYITINKYQVEPQLIGRLRAIMLQVGNTSDTTASANVTDADAARAGEPLPGGKTQAEISAIITAALAQFVMSLNTTDPEMMKMKWTEMIVNLNFKLGFELPKEVINELKLTFTEYMTCGTNFNCHILAGLFIASLVMGISSFGILVLFDCKSNNRLDDVNQKPLVIVAQL